ncbi:MAG: hypothetical protein WCT85_06340 [Parachlamydiales bacterium]|jgi:uncharacterized protein YqgC (DUF456 family)
MKKLIFNKLFKIQMLSKTLAIVFGAFVGFVIGHFIGLIIGAFIGLIFESILVKSINRIRSTN